MAAKSNDALASDLIAGLVKKIREQRVLLDEDLAQLYGVETKALNRAVKRNPDRFPKDFLFQLTQAEFDDLRSQNGTSKTGRGGRRYPPFAFTEHGALQAANVLQSRRATEMSIFVIRAFVKMRGERRISSDLVKRIGEIDQTLLRHNEALRDIYDKLRPLLEESDC